MDEFKHINLQLSYLVGDAFLWTFKIIIDVLRIDLQLCVGRMVVFVLGVHEAHHDGLLQEHHSKEATGSEEVWQVVLYMVWF